jgi:hypothetical protein
MTLVADVKLTYLFDEDQIEWQEKAKAKGLEYFNTDISWLL